MGQTFSKKNKSYYYNNIPNFITEDTDKIIGKLVKGIVKGYDLNEEQEDAWVFQINSLKEKLKASGIDGDIIFEYDIVRLSKRIDVVLLIRHMVFSLEFKNGEKIFKAKDAQQAEDYAIDIKNFHKESEDLYVCPILVATGAKPYAKPQDLGCYSDKQIYLQRENIETLIPKISELISRYGSDEKIDFERWHNSPYYPTPTIINAAIEAYKTKDLTDIARSEAGQDDIEKCINYISEIIEKTKQAKEKSIIFVTGVPGAGKTLVGLDLVAKNLKQGEECLSAYISGNGPLVEVLQAALQKNIEKKKEDSATKKEAIKALIQGSFSFKKAYVSDDSAPAENVIVFDEAQRVWSTKKMKNKHKDDKYQISEPSLLLQIMNRHQEWAAIVCLVGLGQDIYDGEVGIEGWFESLQDEYLNWNFYYSQNIENSLNNDLKEKIIANPRRHTNSLLHLKTSIRSFRADRQAELIDSLLNNNTEKTKEIYLTLKQKYPICITRDINVAKNWARSNIRGSQRCGLIASSNAQRLKPEGIYVPKDIDVVNWFLADSHDIRSSNMLEIAASEFKVQGLEVDYSIMCWDADLRRNNNDWDYYSFRGARWNKIRDEVKRKYLINSYRVLLTRARQGMVIFVPKGVDHEIDETRNNKYYDAIYNYLINCGFDKI